ncbi:MAG: Oxidoreductase domain-containing protein [Promethearchaeota archaeon]|nr:MAG: Oxidoreductase domain-containing protein [Candidatus Lokiarchaeota archaeon]
MNVIKYGIVGLGGAWMFHSAGARENKKIKFTSAFDIDQKKLKKIARIYKMDTFTDYQKFLQSDIDAVLIMVPHYLHEQMVVQAAEAGKHVLCEKPMARTLEECDHMIAVTKKAGVKFMIAENHRFLPAHQYIVDAIQKGWIGRIFLIRAYEGVNEIAGLMNPTLWKGEIDRAGGGALMDMAVHKYATLNWIINDTVESAYTWITKQCTNLQQKAEDNAMSFLEYRNGTIANVTVSFTVVTPPTNSLEIYGTEGTILENHMWPNPVKINSTHKDLGENRNRWYKPDIEHGRFPKYYEISARIEDNYFTECILNDEEPEFTPQQSREAVATVLLSYLSAIKQKTVHYEDLIQIYKNQGTKSIFEGLSDAIINNCPEP